MTAMIDKIRTTIATGAAAASMAGCAGAQPTPRVADSQAVKSVVLVHGAFADGPAGAACTRT